ncbi:PREDICTED: 26S proteasome non-ATPase regulatory subunit 3-like [Thamnophis sirtalis]|uniref:26S proteasome non-ATPase regulatory subunit 3-like n=1 Tax=Thamnophis sirtalis TaxID=35019 RepID=A0A6I9Z4I9_9SAUR|nr:PREDICTED: 26S proteasome non-ATPase regulatory subunit 3-like [Thamnophis sirtalis]
MKQEGGSRRRAGSEKAKLPPAEPPQLLPLAADVEMPEEVPPGEPASAEKSQRELDSVTLEDIKEHVKELEKAVSGKEPRYVLRALRALPSTSRCLNPSVIQKAINGFFTSNSAVFPACFTVPSPREPTLPIYPGL